MPFRRKKKSFFLKNNLFLHFSSFSTFNFFLIISQKNLKTKVERHFKKIMPFETHSLEKFATCSNSEKLQDFFSKKLIYFSKKSQLLKVLRILTNPVALYGNFATIWWKNYEQKRERTSI